MIEKSWIPFGRASQWVIAWLGVAVVALTTSAADELVRIDFRNRIPGVVDAPVFDFDGVSGLQDSRFWAGLYVGLAMDSLTTWGDAYPFLTATNAGYWNYESPLLMVLDEISLGQRIWFQVRIRQIVPVGLFGELIDVGASGIYSMVVTNSVMPMVGLESFSLKPEQLHITRQDDQIVVQWQYLAAHRYELQSTSNLQAPAWTPIFEWCCYGGNLQIFSVTNAVTSTPQFYRLERWRFR